MIYVQEQRQKKGKKAVTTSLVLPGLLAKPGLQSCSSNQQWGHVFHFREREGKGGAKGGLDIHCLPCVCAVVL